MEDGHPSVSSSRANAALKSLGPLSLLDCPHNASVPGRPHAERDQGRGEFPVSNEGSLQDPPSGRLQRL